MGVRRAWHAAPVAWTGALLLAASPALAADNPGIPVTTAQAVRADVPVFTSGIGTVQAYRSVLVRARVDGTLEKVEYTEGQEVRPGDLLAEIDPRPYAATLAQAQAKKAADQAMLANAQRDLVRYTNLVRQDFASRQQMDTQQSVVLQAQANIPGDDAAIASAALNLSFCRITSPIDGVVGLKLVDIGNLVHASDAQGLVTITQIHPISVVFTLPQDQLPAVQAALAAGHAPAVTAFASGGTDALDTGTLLTVDNAVDTSTGTIRLKATFQNPRNHLWPGQFVQARLTLRLEHDVVAVPPAAVQHGPSGLFVYLLRPDGTVHSQMVATGYEDADRAVVTTGLEPGAQVVIGGQSRLQDGTRVAVRQPAAAGG